MVQIETVSGNIGDSAHTVQLDGGADTVILNIKKFWRITETSNEWAEWRVNKWVEDSTVSVINQISYLSVCLAPFVTQDVTPFTGHHFWHAENFEVGDAYEIRIEVYCEMDPTSTIERLMSMERAIFGTGFVNNIEQSRGDIVGIQRLVQKNTLMIESNRTAINTGEGVDYTELINYINGVFALLSSGYVATENKASNAYGEKYYGGK